MNFTQKLLLFNVASVVSSVLVTSSNSASQCEDEIWLDQALYWEKIDVIDNHLIEVSKDYDNVDIYLVTPVHIGCQLHQIDIIAVDPELHDRKEAGQQYINMSLDISGGMNGIENTLMVVTDVKEIPRTIRSRMKNVRQVHVSVQKSRIGQTLAAIASETGVHIKDIEFQSMLRHEEIIVTLEKGSGNRNRACQTAFVNQAHALGHVIKLK